MSRLDVSRWPNGARAAIALTFDNMGEAADLQRDLWPSSEPIGSHHSVERVLPQIITLLRRYDVPMTYFIESWNLSIYPDAISRIVSEGHEIGWHAWQHEPWAKLQSKDAEKDNFRRSFGPEGLEGHGERLGLGKYRGFRPPGGVIHGDRTLRLCQRFGVEYVSPAGEQAALIALAPGGVKEEDGRDRDESIVILPFRWRTVDAYYYMDTFAELRRMKGEISQQAQDPQVLAQAYIREIDNAIEKGEYVSLLFHPFLSDSPQRMQAMETVVAYLQGKRTKGDIWLAKCADIAEWIRRRPDTVGNDPELDSTQWR